MQIRAQNSGKISVKTFNVILNGFASTKISLEICFFALAICVITSRKEKKIKNNDLWGNKAKYRKII